MTKIEVDNHKLMYHPERVAEWRERGDCFPIYVEIGPTNRCNHRCQFCALDWLEHGGADIDSEILCKNLENMANSGVKSVMFAGEGEPLLHEDIGLFCKTAKESGLDVAITTNGSRLNEKKRKECLPYLSWIRFSIDAGTKETYAELHGTEKEMFSVVFDNLKKSIKLKKEENLDVTIGVQALLTNKSLNELVRLAEKLKNIGTDNLQIKPYSHHPSSKNDFSFSFEEAEKIRFGLESFSDEKFQVIYRTQTINRLCSDREYSKCHGLPFFALIDARGNVLPCNMFYNNPEFNYGNLKESSFSEIIKSDNRKKVLEKISERGIEDCRLGCRLDVINRYLERLKNPHSHDKFI